MHNLTRTCRPKEILNLCGIKNMDIKCKVIINRNPQQMSVFLLAPLVSSCLAAFAWEMKINGVSFTPVSSQCQMGDLNAVLVLQECGIDPASDLQPLTAAGRNPHWSERQSLPVLLSWVGCACSLPLGSAGCDAVFPVNMRSALAARMGRAGWSVLPRAAQSRTRYQSIILEAFSWAAGGTQSTFKWFLACLPHLCSSNRAWTAVCAVSTSPLDKLQIPN